MKSFEFKGEVVVRVTGAENEAEARSMFSTSDYGPYKLRGDLPTNHPNAPKCGEVRIYIQPEIPCVEAYDET